MAFDRQIGAITVATEASGEPHQGKVAVAATFFNRLKTGRHGTTIAAACVQRMQYSAWNADQADNRNLMRCAQMADDDPVMLDCLAAYDEAAAGADPTFGACNYYSDTIAPPSWIHGATFTIQIGHHKFYKGVV